MIKKQAVKKIFIGVNGFLCDSYLCTELDPFGKEKIIQKFRNIVFLPKFCR